MQAIGQPVVPSDIAQTVSEALAVADKIGYPVIVRPAFTLGGAGGGAAQDAEELKVIAGTGLDASPITQILVERAIFGWKEIEFETMQVEAFRKVWGFAFATTMCTGNLRSGTEALYSGALHRDRTLIEKGACYYGVICCFIAGAALGTVLSGLFPQRAVLGAAAFQSAAFAAMITGEKRR